MQTEAPGLAALDLEPGSVWSVRAEAPGYWSDVATVVPGTGRSHASLVLWPSTTLGGELFGQPELGAAPALVVSFQGTAAAADGPLPLASADCALSEHRFTCEVPAAATDLRLHVPGYVTHYRWGVTLRAGSTFDLGRIFLQRGASVVGWARRHEDGLPAAGCRIVLERRSAGPVLDPADSERKRLEAGGASPNDRGFFQLAGVAPGEYVLLASAPGFATTVRYPVRVFEDAETELTEPVVLERPIDLAVAIVPATDPWGRRWHVEAMRPGRVPGYSRRLGGSAATPQGEWWLGAIAPGRVELSVLSSDLGTRWHTQEVVAGRDGAHVDLVLDLLPLRGTVTLGDHPLEAKVWFGGQMGAVRIPFETDSEGVFSGYLPKPGRWRVQVRSTQGTIARTLDGVEVTRPPGKALAEVTLRVPDTTLRGRVMDESGAPFRDAAVRTRPRAGGSAEGYQGEHRSGADGRFEIVGLAAGEHVAVARAGGLESDPVVAVVPDQGEAPEVSLVLRERWSVSGIVRTERGGVPGAFVKALTLPASIGGEQAVTDVRGRFVLGLPAACRELLLSVSAPGFSRRALRVPVTRGEELVVDVEQRGGTLTLTWPPRAWERTPLFVVHSGVAEHILEYALWAASQGWTLDEEATAVPVPSLEAGGYSLCAATGRELAMVLAGLAVPSNCSSGYLPPFGELTLTAPRLPDNSRPTRGGLPPGG